MNLKRAKYKKLTYVKMKGAGLTDNGVPYGIFCDEDENDKINIAGIYPNMFEDIDKAHV